MANEYTHRHGAIDFIKNENESIQNEHYNYKDFIIGKMNTSKDKILTEAINEIKSEDIFDLAIKMKSLGINQFFEVLKSELKSLQSKKEFLDDFNLEENELDTIKTNEQIKKEILLVDKIRFKFDEYPVEILSLFNVIFKDDYIEDQERIIEIKNKSKFQLLFNKKERNLNRQIMSYYEKYQDFNLLSGGEDLYLEYISYFNLEKEIDDKNLKIYKLKDLVKGFKQELYIFEKDIEDMKKINDFEKIKIKVIKKFVALSKEIGNTTFYTEKITNHLKNKDLYSQTIIADTHKKHFLQICDIFEKRETLFKSEITEIERKLKYISFCKMEIISFPFFSNVGHFESRVYQYKIAKRDFFKFFENKKIINDDNFENFLKNISKKFTSSVFPYFISDYSKFTLFSKSEVQKFEDQKTFILNKFNKS